MTIAAHRAATTATDADGATRAELWNAVSQRVPDVGEVVRTKIEFCRSLATMPCSVGGSASFRIVTRRC